MKDIKKKYLKEMTDEENPEYMFQGVPTSLVLKVALKKVDAIYQAKKELANRGFDKNGKWIGFPEAKKLWGIK